jgi:hypothetical protein
LRSDAGVKRFPLASGARWYEAHYRALDYPEATLIVAAVVPLFQVILEVSRKLEEVMPLLSQRLAICELPFSSSAGGNPLKIGQLREYPLMIDQNADLIMTYRVTFIVEGGLNCCSSKPGKWLVSWRG